jgi:hypothetical protein
LWKTQRLVDVVLAITLLTLPSEPPMTPLDKPLRREVNIDGKAYTLVLDAVGLKLVPRGHRNGTEILWKDIANGDAAIASALSGSLKNDHE